MSAEEKLDVIEEIVDRWHSYKCVHCGTDLIFEDVGEEFKKSKCPNCVWNDSQYQNQYKALLDIGETVGKIFFLTGSAMAPVT